MALVPNLQGPREAGLPSRGTRIPTAVLSNQLPLVTVATHVLQSSLLTQPSLFPTPHHTALGCSTPTCAAKSVPEATLSMQYRCASALSRCRASLSRISCCGGRGAGTGLRPQVQALAHGWRERSSCCGGRSAGTDNGTEVVTGNTGTGTMVDHGHRHMRGGTREPRNRGPGVVHSRLQMGNQHGTPSCQGGPVTGVSAAQCAHYTAPAGCYHPPLYPQHAPLACPAGAWRCRPLWCRT